MQLELKNIGMIKEASVKIDGLTVIAGENDTGKSTCAKVLFYGLTTIKKIKLRNGKNTTILDTAKVLACTDIFKVDISQGINVGYLEKSEINITMGEQIINPKLGLGVSPKQIMAKVENLIIPEVTFVETPIVWNFTDFFRDIAQVESQMNLKLDYPYLMKDLNFKLHIKSASDGIDIKNKMTDLMGGEFKKDEMGRYYFDKNGQRIDLVNTATGIKTFGLFQVLSQNNYLNKDTVLILDEPEVHLHPKWQLEMAKIIVELVDDGVKIVVNSHSPYMIEALKRYSEVEKIEDKTNFYLAENGYIEHQESLENIFEKLAIPMRELKKLKMDKYLND